MNYNCFMAIAKLIRTYFKYLSLDEKISLKRYIYDNDNDEDLNDEMWEYLVGDRELKNNELVFKLWNEEVGK